ncbi:MAG: hypothetical protein NTX00_00770 [Candidatus Parcubacteria bacterium]|nr:hypothetical protein [Candidatus Parcubacteria bacterium]
MKKIMAAFLTIAVMSGIFGCVHPHSTATYTCPLYRVTISGVGTNAATIEALGKYKVFEGAQLTIDAIRELTPILAANGYRARISADKVIIEPIPRDILVSIENFFPDKAIKIVIYNEERQLVWTCSGISPGKAELTVLKAGHYIVQSSFVGESIIAITNYEIPDRDYKEYSRLANKYVGCRLFWPSTAE